ncbi:hypothetical protein CUJ90_08865 [Paraburkholderia terricola]|nr:hypothetical protein CUJ90_08865 [Paraburkholderia terricola]
MGLGVYEVDVRREYALIDIIQIITDKQCSSFIDGMVASRLNGPTDAAATPATMSSPSIVSVGISR